MVYREGAYSFKVWLSTITVARVIFLIIVNALSGFAFDEPASDWYLYIFYYLAFITITGVFSFLVFAIFLVMVKITVTYSKSIAQCKSIISCGGFLLCIGTFWIVAYLFTGEFHVGILYLASCYGVCAAWFSWLYQLAESSGDIKTSPIIINN